MAKESADDDRALTVVVSGAESAGKTTLAQALSKSLGVPWVAEYARRFLSDRNRAQQTDYVEDDLVTIARIQAEHEIAAAQTHSLVIADTDVLVIRQWAIVKYGVCPPAIEALVEAMLAEARPRLYLVPRPDMPWQYDPLRENPNDRMQLHRQHLGMLQEFGVDSLELTGTHEARLEAALDAIRKRLVARRDRYT